MVTSLFPKNIQSDLGENFKKFIEYKDAKSSLLKKYIDNFDFDELCKLAIDYSDGIVLAENEVSTSLVDYANEKSVPLLGYQEDFADAYEAFYQQICPEDETE